MSLKDFLASHDYTSTTEGGYQWLRKALHPADVTIKAPRAPSHGTRPTATQECTVTFAVDAPAPDPAEPDAPWRMGIFMKNDPLAPIQLAYANETTAAPNTTRLVGLNQCFANGLGPVSSSFTQADYNSVLNFFRASCEQYRVNALSFTGVFIGATLTDQGSVVSAQVADAHQDACIIPGSLDTTTNGVSHRAYLITQLPPYSDSLVMGSSAYVRKAKEGVYVPYKMQHPGEWFSSDNICRVVRTANAFTGLYNKWADVSTSPYPHGNVLGDHHTPGMWLPPLDDNLSVTWFTGLARTTSFRITYRICIEVMTRPDSMLAPFCELPALPDDHATVMYYEIASRLKDAYPSDDNDKGTLWNKVKDIARGIWSVASPALATAFPGVGSALVGAVDAVRAAAPPVLAALRAKGQAEFNQGRKKKKTPEAAAAANQATSLAERAGAGTRTTSYQVIGKDGKLRTVKAKRKAKLAIARPKRA